MSKIAAGTGVDIVGIILLMRTAIYTRVSTEEQAGSDKGSHEDQIERAKRTIQEHSWELVNIYQDTQKGHEIANRLELLKLLEDAKFRKFDLVIVRDADRLARDRATATIIREQLKDCLVQVYSIDQPREPIPPDKYDPDEDDSGVIYEGISDIKADLDIKSLRRKVRQGAKNRALKGMLHDVPYGYDKEYVSIHPSVILKVTENEKEAEVIRNMFNWYGNRDYSYRRIATELNESKIPSPTGKLWSCAYIQRILKNPVFIGYVRHNHRPTKRGKRLITPKEEWILVKGTHPVIVAEDLFNKVQERIKQKTSLRGRVVGSKGLLVGLAKCGYCGRNIYYKTNRRSLMQREKYPNTKPYFSYYCASSYSYGNGITECKGHIMGATKLEGAVITKIQQIVNNPAIYKEFMQRATDDGKKEEEQEKAHLVATLETLTEAAKRHWQAYEASVITLQDYAVAKEENLAQIEEAKNKLAILEEKLSKSLDKEALTKQKKAFLKDFSTKFDKAQLEIKRRILQGLIGSIIVKKDRVKINFIA